MSHSKKPRKPDDGHQSPVRDSSGGVARKPTRPRLKRSRAQSFKSIVLLRHPIARFVVFLLILLGLFEVFLATRFAKEEFNPPYLRFCARLSGGVMAAFGENVTVNGSTIHGERFDVNIKKGCDAMQPIALFVAAVLASPVVLRTKLLGLVAGLFFLQVMNLVRVISLFYVGIYFPGAFDIMHHDVWQGTFIILAVLAWALWALWAAGRTVERAHATP